MKSESRFVGTISYYDNYADKWAQAKHCYEEGLYWEAEMNRFQELLPSGRILEVGSGTGKDAEALINLGYEYAGTDASKGMLGIAKKRLPKADFRLMSVLDLNFPENSFDGFWTAATLLHIPKDSIETALENIKRVTKTVGIGFISMKEGTEEVEDKETGRWFSYYSQEEFESILKRCGFEIVQSSVRQGEKDIWLIFFVRVEK